MLTIQGRPQAACDGLTRRDLLQAGGAGLFGMSLPQLLAAESSAGFPARAKSVIFLMLFGGPSQLETFDMKPEAPEIIRGPFKPVASRTSGLQICEHLSRTAALSDKFCVIRTMSHDFNDHSGGGHYVQTGQKWHIPIGGGFSATPKDWPSIGSVVEYCGQKAPGGAERDLPNYMVLPNRLGRLEDRGQYIRPGEYAGWLGRSFDPLSTTVDKKSLTDNPYWRDCTDEELTFEIEGLARDRALTLDRVNRRRSILEQFDAGRAGLTGSSVTRAYDRFQQRALALVTSEKTREALNLRHEPAALRDRYGRHLFGQSALMARRLVEAGVRFVTVHYEAVDGYSWDSHLNSDDVGKNLIPTLDQAYSALITDLDERGMLDETLVVTIGEMGRTPRGNATWGRGHWSTVFPAVLAGGGIRGGVCHGSTDKDAAYALEQPVKPEDLAATLYYALGIDPDIRLPDAQGRPTPIVEGGAPLTQLFG